MFGVRCWEGCALESEVWLADVAATLELGRQIGRGARAGDLIVLSGELGAGKTTLAQGIGQGLGVRGPVTSPTFVIARVHPTVTDGPDMLHVDAYRLGSADELDALDLDTTMASAVTVVEWGEGMAEALSPTRIEVRLERQRGAPMSPTENP
ncbi:MAG: tRNA (adenosine(37)-N6)-threonylcarbamoyltransferase complex ATPase subunit type 1 TsaE, partial [Bifidobacteriaceae bacterium]|nr:tRNA (adenosine(37)-N6)-threonylcarbamoyltransferase complex ATPase subunit type 1 TsaE [Bifidobacteriaceae bacterium]